jgi:predicted DNA-binding transcriptional regulator AlpA
MVASSKPRVTRKGTIFPRINSAARALGVHRVTLYRVLKGQIPDNQKLTARYYAFLAAELAPDAAPSTPKP